MTNFQLSRRRQRELFLLTSGLSTAGSFAGITAKGWILMKGTADPMVLALNFAALSLPSLLVSGPAGVWTDRFGSERVLIRAQWGLLAAAMLGAVSIPWFTGQAQVVMLLIRKHVEIHVVILKNGSRMRMLIRLNDGKLVTHSGVMLIP